MLAFLKYCYHLFDMRRDLAQFLYQPSGAVTLWFILLKLKILIILFIHVYKIKNNFYFPLKIDYFISSHLFY